MRSVPFAGAIWIGTALLGAAIATLNVLIPSLVKREYPTKVGLMTGLYSAVQSSMAALAAGLAVPIAGTTGLGWRLSLGVWAGLALIGFAVFLPTLRARVRSRQAATVTPTDTDTPTPERVPSMLRSPIAWYVTLFLGLQSAIYFTVITWWPTIEQDSGFSAAAAGWHQFAFQSAGILGSLSAAVLLHRMQNQSGIAVGAAVFALLGLGGQLLLPHLSLAWALLLGVACGIAITTALSLFGLRTRNHHQAAALSGMAQSIGYLLASLGPVLVGALHDATGSWRPGLLVIMVSTCGMLVFGLLAGKSRYITPRKRGE